MTERMATNHEGKKTFQAAVLVRQLQMVNHQLYPENFIQSTCIACTCTKLMKISSMYCTCTYIQMMSAVKGATIQ